MTLLVSYTKLRESIRQRYQEPRCGALEQRFPQMRPRSEEIVWPASGNATLPADRRIWADCVDNQTQSQA